jgi:hypothetical protein
MDFKNANSNGKIVISSNLDSIDFFCFENYENRAQK